MCFKRKDMKNWWILTIIFIFVIFFGYLIILSNIQTEDKDLRKQNILFDSQNPYGKISINELLQRKYKDVENECDGEKCSQFVIHYENMEIAGFTNNVISFISVLAVSFFSQTVVLGSPKIFMDVYTTRNPVFKKYFSLNDPDSFNLRCVTSGKKKFSLTGESGPYYQARGGYFLDDMFTSEKSYHKELSFKENDCGTNYLSWSRFDIPIKFIFSSKTKTKMLFDYRLLDGFEEVVNQVQKLEMPYYYPYLGFPAEITMKLLGSIFNEIFVLKEKYRKLLDEFKEKHVEGILITVHLRKFDSLSGMKQDLTAECISRIIPKRVKSNSPIKSVTIFITGTVGVDHGSRDKNVFDVFKNYMKWFKNLEKEHKKLKGLKVKFITGRQLESFVKEKYPTTSNKILTLLDWEFLSWGDYSFIRFSSARSKFFPPYRLLCYPDMHSDYCICGRSYKCPAIGRLSSAFQGENKKFVENEERGKKYCFTDYDLYLDKIIKRI